MSITVEEIYEAAKAEDIGKLEEYGKAGADFNQVMDDEFLLPEVIDYLMYSETGKKYDVIKTLIKYGANPNLHGYDMFSPLFYPILNIDLKMIRLLLEAGVDPNTISEWQSIYSYAEFDYRYTLYDLKAPEDPSDFDCIGEDNWLRYLDRIAVKYNLLRPKHLFLLREFGAKTTYEIKCAARENHINFRFLKFKNCDAIWELAGCGKYKKIVVPFESSDSLGKIFDFAAYLNYRGYIGDMAPARDYITKSITVYCDGRECRLNFINIKWGKSVLQIRDIESDTVLFENGVDADLVTENLTDSVRDIYARYNFAAYKEKFKIAFPLLGYIKLNSTPSKYFENSTSVKWFFSRFKSFVKGVKIRPVITVMADFGNTPYAWRKNFASDDVGYCIADGVGGFYGDYEVSSNLKTSFKEWISDFTDKYNTINFDWEEWNQVGLSLTRKLKNELGDAYDYVYCIPFWDPRYRRDDERRNIVIE